MEKSAFERRPYEGRGRARVECAQFPGGGITDIPSRVLIENVHEGFGGAISRDSGELANGCFSQFGMGVALDEVEEKILDLQVVKFPRLRVLEVRGLRAENLERELSRGVVASNFWW